MFLFFYLNFLIKKDPVLIFLLSWCILLLFILVVKLLLIILLALIEIVYIRPAIVRMRNLLSCMFLGLFFKPFIITYRKLWSSQKIWSSFNEFLLIYWIQIFIFLKNWFIMANISFLTIYFYCIASKIKIITFKIDTYSNSISGMIYKKKNFIYISVFIFTLNFIKK